MRFVFLLFLIFSLSSCKKYTLTTDVYPESSGSVNPSKGIYKKKSLVTVEAIPKENFKFVKWGLNPIVGYGDNTNPLQFNIFEDITLVAEFELIDEDGDGIPDNLDDCPNSPPGVIVNSDGCALSQKDTDGDGVTDDKDNCDDTPEGEDVNENGCSDSQKDTDGDGVTDDKDTCNDTPEGEDIDENGCSDSQKDSDGDGVTDDKDLCPDTPLGVNVDENGCSLYGDLTKILTFGSYVTETDENTFKTFTKIPATSVFVNEGLQGIMGFDFDSDGNAYFVHNYRGGGYFFRMLPDNNNILSFDIREDNGHENVKVWMRSGYRDYHPDNIVYHNGDIYFTNAYSDTQLKKFNKSDLLGTTSNSVTVSNYSTGVSGGGLGYAMEHIDINQSGVLYAVGQNSNNKMCIFKKDVNSFSTSGNNTLTTLVEDIDSHFNLGFTYSGASHYDYVSDIKLSDNYIYISYFHPHSNDPAVGNPYNRVLKVSINDLNDYEIIDIPDVATYTNNNLAEDWTTTYKYNSLSVIDDNRFVLSSGGLGKLYYYDGSQVIDISNETSSSFERPIAIQYYDGYIYLIDESQTLKNCEVFANGTFCYADFYFYRIKLN